ncbi:Guanine nucleotide-binding protein-like 3 [Boothiomyces sp. JEL0838]|nr:Guanine nucleotide-binding protein-like 3 [Boothiomyces sp. JEL0838]
MARGDSRKKNIKRDWINVPASKATDSKVQTKGKAMKKDLGVPDLRQFSKKLMRHVVKEKEEELKEQTRLRMLASGMTPEQFALAELANKAAARNAMYSNNHPEAPSNFEGVYQGDAAVTGKKDNSRKAYYREFKKVIEQADVILEILDARDPMGCRTKEVEEMILNAGASKKIILIMNKIDLVPRDAVESWLKYLRNEYPTIAFKASTQNQRQNLGQSNVATNVASEALLSGSECLGADTLIKLLKNYCRNVNLKTSITVGVVGFPNVGKSSVINSLKRSKVCGVGSTPGVTKVAQTIHLDKNIKLLDCPGIVFSKSSNTKDTAQVLLRNCIKVELLEDPISPVDAILERCSVEQLRELYGLPEFHDTQSFLIEYARLRGKLLRGGIPDVESAARAIIQDWNQGRIPFYTVPPESGISKGPHVSSEIVSGWSAEFSLDGLIDSEILEESKPTSEKMIAIPVTEAAPQDDMEIDQPLQEFNPSVPEIRFKPAVKKVVVIDKKEPMFTQEEIDINPQVGLSLKKLAKKSKKAARRKMKSDDVNESDIDMSN